MSEPPMTGATSETAPSPLRLSPQTQPGAPEPKSVPLRVELGVALPGFLVTGLMLVWAVHDGGFGEDTWYWGALGMLALTGGSWAALGPRRRRLSRSTTVAIVLFAAYVGWSYLSMTWSVDAGAAWEGSNRALLYLLTFVLMTILPWRPRAVVVALLVFAVGIGATATVLLVRVADGDRLNALFSQGRLAAPTGYFNASAALFTMGALVAIGLASRAELRRALGGVLRGALLGLATADLCMAITVQSRGWLFTLPIVAVISIVICRDRLAVTAAGILPVIGAALDTRRLIDDIGTPTSARSLDHLAPIAGHAALLLCFAVFAVGTILISLTLMRPPTLSRRVRTAVGTVLIAVAVVGALGVLEVVSDHHPGHYLSQQWHGFAHEPGAADTTSHFEVSGSGRYDFWRVGLEAVRAHPVGGLGQDNYLDYYLLHRKTNEEPLYAHSLEIRLLASTGVVGFALFFAFLIAAVAAALRARRRGDSLARGVAAIALLPLIVWLVHGSIDWFWEIPALSAPALGFLGMSGALAAESRAATAPSRSPRRRLAARTVAGALATVALVAATGSLAFPYLSAREVSVGSYIQNIDPDRSLADLQRAGRLNPLDPTPGITGGAVAIRNHRWKLAESEFSQALHRDPGNWISWLGAGLAASEQGDAATAKTDFRNAVRINPLQTADLEALKRVDTAHPLGAIDGLDMLTDFDN